MIYEGKRICPSGIHVKDVCRITVYAPWLIHYRCLVCEHEWRCYAEPVGL